MDSTLSIFALPVLFVLICLCFIAYNRYSYRLKRRGSNDRHFKCEAPISFIDISHVAMTNSSPSSKFGLGDNGSKAASHATLDIPPSYQSLFGGTGVGSKKSKSSTPVFSHNEVLSYHI